jgi:hypothetical protein
MFAIRASLFVDREPFLLFDQSSLIP